MIGVSSLSTVCLLEQSFPFGSTSLGSTNKTQIMLFTVKITVFYLYSKTFSEQEDSQHLDSRLWTNSKMK